MAQGCRPPLKQAAPARRETVQLILDVGLQQLVVFVMTATDFANVRRYPGAIALVLVGQWIALPLAATLFVQGLRMPDASSCPE